jgi:hypothetical protein
MKADFKPCDLEKNVYFSLKTGAFSLHFQENHTAKTIKGS